MPGARVWVACLICAVIPTPAWPAGEPEPLRSEDPRSLRVCGEIEAIAEIRALRAGGAGYGDVESRARALLPGIEGQHGPASIEAACLLDLLVESLWRGGHAKAPDALALASRAVEAKKARLGPVHLEVTDSLRNQGILLEDTGNPAGAVPVHAEAVRIRREILGPDHLETARALTDLANVYLALDRHAESRPNYEEALRIQLTAAERAASPEKERAARLDATRTMTNLGLLLREMGEYDASEARLRQALTERTSLIGERSREVASTLDHLGTLYWEIADYDQAVAAYRRALEIREELSGPASEQVALTLQNLGNAYREAGLYRDARATYQRSLAIIDETGSSDLASRARLAHNMAQLLTRTGEYERARSLFEEARGIRIERHGPGHIEVANSEEWLGNLASAEAVRALEGGDELEAARLMERAMTHYELALRIVRETLGRQTWDYAQILGRASAVLARSGRAGDARARLDEALAIESVILPEGHPWIARTLESIASLDAAAGDPQAARERYELALGIARRSLGNDHPMVGSILAGLGLVHARLGRQDDGVRAALQAERIGRSHLEETVRTLSEGEALRYAGVRESGMDVALSITAATPAPGSVRSVWDALIRSRALVLDATAARRRWESAHVTPEIARLRDDLAVARRHRAHLVHRGPERNHSERFAEQIEAARAREEAAEAALAEQTGWVREADRRAGAGLDEVAAALPSDTALVAFVRYGKLDLSARPAAGHPVRVSVPHDPTTGPREPSFMAFVMTSSDGAVEAIPLGPAAAIERLAIDWVRQAGQAPPGDPEGYRTATERTIEAGHALRRAIWDRVATRARKAARILVVPDGILHLVNIAALPSMPGGYLVESGPLLHYLTAERDVLRPSRSSPAGHGLLAVGGPDFGGAADGPLDGGAGGLREIAACAELKGVHFPPLPASNEEIQEILGLWRESFETEERRVSYAASREETAEDVRRLTGADATEERFKREAPGRRIVHLATHGFFLGGSCASPGAGSRSISTLSAPRFEAAVPAGGDNPLLLSGLALAGANRWQEAAAEDEDGILTAAEITTMDLAGTEWAVLSACDTGVGEISDGEGVLGLRRAVEIAGADTVIMSLWKVGDTAARDWMAELYRARLIEHLPTAEAVRQATLRRLGRLGAGRGPAHPHDWAAFVAAGDWD